MLLTPCQVLLSFLLHKSERKRHFHSNHRKLPFHLIRIVRNHILGLVRELIEGIDKQPGFIGKPEPAGR